MTPSPPLPPGVEQLLKPEAVAKLLGCSKAVIYSDAKSGRLPCVIVAEKLVRFEMAGIRSYIEARRKGAA